MSESFSSPTRFSAPQPAKSGVWPFRLIDRWLSDKRNNISRPKLLFIACAFDILMIAGAGAVALGMFGAPSLSPWLIAALVIGIATLTVAVYSSCWIYTIRGLSSANGQIAKTSVWLIAIVCGVLGVSNLLGLDLPADGFLPWVMIAIAGIAVTRLIIAEAISAWAKADRLVRRTVIVGGGETADELISKLTTHARDSITIMGLFDDRDDDRSTDGVGGVAKLGNFDQLGPFCRDAGVDLVIVNVPVGAERRLLEIMKFVFPLPVEVRVSALQSNLRLAPRMYHEIGSVPMLSIMDRPLSDWDRVLKNLEDRIVGTLLLAAVAPIMAIVAIAIRLDSRGPILFKQKRFGFNNEAIEVYKFRSMYTDKADANAEKLVTRGDPRVTKVGAFLRRSSLDELPQLINVVRGEMSLVGPRPHAAQAKADGDLYHSVVDGYFSRHRMKPGMTGWAQINGWRGETDTHEKIENRVRYDLEYIDRWSVFFDLYIIARTPFALASDKNAY
jgi:Undecaprenyl-phosphate glucose phosphotransferase